MPIYDPNTVVVEGTRSGMDGQWWAVQDRLQFVVATQNFLQDYSVSEGDEISPSLTYHRMLPAGRLRWDGDRCAEVYVPEGMRGEWAREFDLPRSQPDSPYVLLYIEGRGYWTFVDRYMRSGLTEDGFVATDRFASVFDLPPSEILVLRRHIPDWVSGWVEP